MDKKNGGYEKYDYSDVIFFFKTQFNVHKKTISIE